MSIHIVCESASIEGAQGATVPAGWRRRAIRVTIDGFDIEDILGELGVPDVLDRIGKEACLSHFGITEQEEAQ